MKKLTIIGITLTLLLGLTLWQQQLFAAKAAPMFMTHTVINTADSGPGSLRQAIADAASGDTIDFDTSGVFATLQTITLTSGQLFFNKSLTIDVPGASQLTVSGNNTSRVFLILSGHTVTLDGLTVSRGFSFDDAGGGIFNGGTLTLTNSTVSGNDGGGAGAGTLDINTVLNTTLASNGGPTLTHALVPGSPAFDAGSNALAVDANDQPLTTDQRGTGFPRIDGGTVDIGAYEGAFNASPTIAGATISRQAGSPASSAQIATVSDVEDDEETLAVTATPLSGSGVRNLPDSGRQTQRRHRTFR